MSLDEGVMSVSFRLDDRMIVLNSFLVYHILAFVQGRNISFSLCNTRFPLMPFFLRQMPCSRYIRVELQVQTSRTLTHSTSVI